MLEKSLAYFDNLQNKSMKKMLLSCFFFDGKRMHKLIRCMKLTFIIVLLSCLQVSAHVDGQNMFTLRMDHVRIDKVLNKIQKKSSYRFFYNERFLEHLNPVSVNVKKATLAEVMEQLLDGSLSYKVIDKNLVVISPNEELLEQQHSVQGTVTNEQGTPLVGVTVKVKGTSQGTVTDAQGNFTLVVPDNAILEISYIGFETQEIAVGNRTELSITMQASARGLNEVVVVGYGTQKKVTLTGSVSTVSMKTLEQAPVTNFSNSLAGRLAGVITITGSGEPGENSSNILIRGNHSLNNNAPLVVIDGVPNRGGGLGSLDPNDIESISVLKDATASIYGSQAANGVILITTKRGHLNQAPKFTLTFNQGYNQPTRIPEMADAPTYMTMVNEIATYEGTPKSFSQKDIDAYNNSNRDPWLYPNTNWFNATFKPLSPQTKGNISVQGGSSKFTYFLSLGGRTNEGYYKNSATRYNQFNLRSNVGGQITKNIKLSLDLSARKEDRHFPTVSASNTFWMLIRGRPTDPAYFPNGLPGPDQENGWQPVVTGTTQTGFHDNQETFLTGDLMLDVTIPGLEGFDIKGHVSYNKEFQTIKDWQIPWTLYSFDKQAYINNGEKDPEQFLTPLKRGPTDPQLNQSFYQQHKALGNITANYKRSFGDNNVSLMLGTEVQQFRDNRFSAFRRHFISTAIPELFAGGQKDWSNDGSAAEGARLSYFGRATYNYKGKYLLEAIGRYDGSYLFPSNSRFGFFPAISAGWRLSEEPFFRDNVGFFNELKLRASWGKTGNDITNPDALVEPEQFLSGYEFGGGYVFGVDQALSTIQSSRVANPNITWERANMFDIGVDGVTFDNKLSFTLDYWNQLRSGILIQRNASVPKTTGLTLPRENLGKVKSWGGDGNITWNQSVNQNFSFQIGLNAGYSTTKIVFWDEPPGAADYQRSTDLKINTGLYYKVLGVFQNEKEVESTTHWPGARPGDLIFKDVGSDPSGPNKGKPDGIINAFDRIRVNKNHAPNWTGGLSLAASWKQWNASVLLQGAAGAVQYVALTSGIIGNYFEAFAEKRWRPDPDDETGMTPDPSGLPYSGPRTYNRDQPYWSPTSNNNTYFLRSTDYVRLKTLEIGYSLPQTLLSKLGGIQSFRIYVSGYNLITWDKFKLMDPEASSSSGRFYPQTRIFNGGFELSF